MQRMRLRERSSVTIHQMHILWLELQEYFISIQFLAVDSQSHTYFHLFRRNCRRDKLGCLLLNVGRAVENIKAVHEMCLNIWIPSANTKTIRKESGFTVEPFFQRNRKHVRIICRLFISKFMITACGKTWNISWWIMMDSVL
jgi:hypothetical protein